MLVDITYWKCIKRMIPDAGHLDPGAITNAPMSSSLMRFPKLFFSDTVLPLVCCVGIIGNLTAVLVLLSPLMR